MALNIKKSKYHLCYECRGYSLEDNFDEDIFDVIIITHRFQLCRKCLEKFVSKINKELNGK